MPFLMQANGEERSLNDLLLGAIGKVALLLLGALFTVGLGHFLSERWQARQQELAVKDTLIQEMSAASAAIVAAAQTHEFHGQKEEPGAYVRAFRDWDAASQTIAGKLATYFPDESELRVEWRRFSDRMLDFYNLADQPGWREPTLRAETLAALEEYIAAAIQLPKRPESNDELRRDVGYQRKWRDLKMAVLGRRDRIVERVLRADIAD